MRRCRGTLRRENSGHGIRCCNGVVDHMSFAIYIKRFQAASCGSVDSELIMMLAVEGIWSSALIYRAVALQCVTI